jgi:hypothetical protein
MTTKTLTERFVPSLGFIGERFALAAKKAAAPNQ